jgi:hypothetical protein
MNVDEDQNEVRTKFGGDALAAKFAGLTTCTLKKQKVKLNRYHQSTATKYIMLNVDSYDHETP